MDSYQENVEGEQGKLKLILREEIMTQRGRNYLLDELGKKRLGMRHE